MTIRIEDGAYPFMELLFVRDAWHLEVSEVPAIEPSHLIPSISPPPGMTAAELRNDWLQQWRSGWERYDLRVGAAVPPNRIRRELIDATPDDQLDTLFAGRGRSLVEEDSLDAFNAWQETLRDQHDIPLAHTPERLSLPALVGAWERGLTTIVQLPFEGHYAVSRNDQYIVVSNHTRTTPRLFTQALMNH